VSARLPGRALRIDTGDAKPARPIAHRQTNRSWGTYLAIPGPRGELGFLVPGASSAARASRNGARSEHVTDAPDSRAVLPRELITDYSPPRSVAIGTRRSFFAEDMIVQIPGRSPLAGDWRGKQAAVDYIRNIRETVRRRPDRAGPAMWRLYPKLCRADRTGRMSERSPAERESEVSGGRRDVRERRPPRGRPSLRSFDRCATGVNRCRP
jgi:hypothetical protein